MASLDICSERGRTFNRDGSVDEDLPNCVIPDFQGCSYVKREVKLYAVMFHCVR